MTGKKRGRPPYKPTPGDRRTVEQMRACGEPAARIARALGIDDATLVKHFAAELESGFSRRRREVVDLLFAQARKGNVTAIKKLEEMTRLTGAEAEIASAPAPQPSAAKAPRQGKKEAANEAARTAGVGTDWGDDLMPPGAAVN